MAQVARDEAEGADGETTGRLMTTNHPPAFAHVYRAIHAGLLNPPGTAEKFVLRKLRHHEKRRHKKGSEEHRGKVVISHPIEERPASAANCSVRGH